MVWRKIRSILGGVPLPVNAASRRRRPTDSSVPPSGVGAWRGVRARGAGAGLPAAWLRVTLLLATVVWAAAGCRSQAPALLSADEAANAGLERLQQGEATEAKKLLERARRQGKGDTETYRGLAAAYFISGDTTRAIETLESASEKRVRDAELWHLLGSLQLQAGRDREGFASLERAASLSRSWEFWRDLGEVRLARDPERGLRELQQAWRLAPAGILRSQVAFQIAKAELARGRRPAAGGWYRRALRDDPNNQQAKEALRALGRDR